MTFLIYPLWWQKPQAVISMTELPVSTDSNQSSPIFGTLFHDRVSRSRESVLMSDVDGAIKSLGHEYMLNDPFSEESVGHFALGILLGRIVLSVVGIDQ
jgi:hypothetical protein